MIPGPDLYYKYPYCGKIHVTSSLISGNTFRTERYTDSRRISPMMPEFPIITKCLQYSLIFWSDETT
jgi:hypothetical protein